MEESNIILPWYKQWVLYTGIISLISIFVFIYSVNNLGAENNILYISLFAAGGFGFLTYYFWKSMCPKCRRALMKNERIDWREDLGIKKEPYTYYAKVYEYDDGSTEKTDKRTIMRDRQHFNHYFICKNCKHGEDRNWSEKSSKWLGAEPAVKKINKKSSGGFGLNLFEEDTYEYKGKRKNIPKGVKQDLWVRHFGKKYKGNCFVCQNVIDTHSFEAGHVKSVAHGGSDNISNLKPICAKCNKAMGPQNLNEYKRIYYPKRK